MREWLRAQGFEGKLGQTPPHMPFDKIEEVRQKYIDLYEDMTAKKFHAQDYSKDPNERIRTNITNFLERVKPDDLSSL